MPPSIHLPLRRWLKMCSMMVAKFLNSGQESSIAWYWDLAISDFIANLYRENNKCYITLNKSYNFVKGNCWSRVKSTASHETLKVHSTLPKLNSHIKVKGKERIIFKILLFVYHIINGTAPDYNESLLRLYRPTRTLRSSNSCLLQIPLSKKSWGERAFAHAGPALWNSLPQELSWRTQILQHPLSAT